MKVCKKCEHEYPEDASHFVARKNRRGEVYLGPVCRACESARVREYSARDPQRSRQRKRDYYAANKEACKARCLRWRRTPQGREALRLSRIKDADKTKARVRAWQQANWVRAKAYKALSRATRKAAPGVTTGEDLQRQFEKQDGRCYYCGDPLAQYHIDHYVPIARGGTNWPDNIVLACRTCNLSKGHKTPDEYFSFLRTKRLNI